MLKPRYPLSECEIPQTASGSTPSSASSPYTSTRSGLPSHELTPNSNSNPIPNSTSNGNTHGHGHGATTTTTTTTNPVGRKRKRFELDFVHLDPVLSVHMRMQSMSMLGRGVIEFIHPEEREQARRDLYSSTRVNNLEGSVTRVRFARLSRIRTILGCPPEDEDIPSDAYKFVEDDEYLILDLSLHWACDGLILAFFHAIKDKDKEMDNDPKLRHQEWSNYCGTPGFTDEDVEYMWNDVSKALPVKPIVAPAPPPERVFLIHATEESNVRPDTVIFAWPPPRIRKRSELVPRMDGRYWAQDYAELMKHVELENKTGQPDAWGTFGKTSCTQRFQGGHLLTNEGVWRKIESVFIPYGKITFACFQTVSISPLGEAPTLPTHDQYPIDPRGIKRKPYEMEDGNMINGVDFDEQYMPYPQPIMPMSTIGKPPYPGDQTASSIGIEYPQPVLMRGNATLSEQQENDNRKKAAAVAAVEKEPLRPAVPPPDGIECCIQCATKESPEWRKSENGIKNLCNACGLKLARLQAKREGRQKPRKKKPPAAVTSSPMGPEFSQSSGSRSQNGRSSASGPPINGHSWSGQA
ncbi:hypothetical protein FFLO_06407 [Filobasidium floriforme]|uniref:GATA-type domain-containing protein n=1 Tax=Filobasidium floriforme TaxID=5210 RepID=A0A8K0JGB8_9TREE|nr:hypothetical protein FFLO_06407 [Filobasidium floriforme]